MDGILSLFAHLSFSTRHWFRNTSYLSRSYFRTGPYFYLDFIQARIYGHLVSKESPGSAGDPDLIPRLGRSSGEGNGNPLEYPCLEIPWTEEPGRLQSMGLQRVRHNWVTNTGTFTIWGIAKLFCSNCAIFTCPPSIHQCYVFQLLYILADTCYFSIF